MPTKTLNTKETKILFEYTYGVRITTESGCYLKLISHKEWRELGLKRLEGKHNCTLRRTSYGFFIKGKGVQMKKPKTSVEVTLSRDCMYHLGSPRSSIPLCSVTWRRLTGVALQPESSCRIRITQTKTGVRFTVKG